jgi:hypothetical protein
VAIETLDDFNVWQLQNTFVTDLLCRIEEAEREILRVTNWPTEPIAILDALEGRIAAPILDARNNRRVSLAMHALLQTGIARQNLGPLDQNAPAAAHAAMMATALAWDIVAKRIQSDVLKTGPKRAAENRAQDAKKHDGLIRKLYNECSSDGPESVKIDRVIRQLKSSKKGTKSRKQIRDSLSRSDRS